MLQKRKRLSSACKVACYTQVKEERNNLQRMVDELLDHEAPLGSGRARSASPSKQSSLTTFRSAYITAVWRQICTRSRCPMHALSHALPWRHASNSASLPENDSVWHAWYSCCRHALDDGAHRLKTAVYDELHHSGGGAIKAQAGRPGMPADKEAGYQQRIQDLENQVQNERQATSRVHSCVTKSISPGEVLTATEHNCATDAASKGTADGALPPDLHQIVNTLCPAPCSVARRWRSSGSSA